MICLQKWFGGFGVIVHNMYNEIVASINIRVPSSLSWIIMFGLLLGMVLSVCSCTFHKMVTLPSRLASIDFGIWPYQCSSSDFTLLLLLLLLLLFKHNLYGRYTNTIGVPQPNYLPSHSRESNVHNYSELKSHT